MFITKLHYNNAINHYLSFVTVMKQQITSKNLFLSNYNNYDKDLGILKQ